MQRFLPLILLLLVTPGQRAQAQRTCSDHACVYTQDGRDEVTIWVEAIDTEPVRLVLVVNHLNMVPDKDLPYTDLYQPGTTTKALTLRRFRQDEPVNYKVRFYSLPGHEGDLSCREKLACVSSRFVDGEVIFRAINLTDRVLSLEFQPTEFVNLNSRERLPVTRVIPPADTVLLTTTYVPDRSKAHRYRYNYKVRTGAAGQRHALGVGYLIPHTVPDRPVRKGRSTRPDERNGVYWYVPDGGTVRAARTGRVVGSRASTQDSLEVHTLTVQHEDGSQAVYRYLDRLDVAEDSLITAGSILGHAPQFVMLTVQILKPDFTYVSVPIRFHLRDGSVRSLRTGEIY